MKRAILFFAFCAGLTSLYAAPAPNFTVTTSDGVSRNLYQDFINKQKLVVIQAFNTTCTTCNDEAAYVQALYLQMQVNHPNQVEFLLLSTLNTDSNSIVKQYRANKGLTMLAAGFDGNSIAALQPYTNGQFGFFQGAPTFIVVAPVTGEVYFDIRGSSLDQTIALLQQRIESTIPQECVIKTYSGNLADSVAMQIHTPVFDTTIQVNGYYTLAFIQKLVNQPYVLTLNKPGDPIAGVSTFDLVRIAKHILNIEPFDGDWQFTAADVNCSGTVTTTDIVHIRRLILGLTDTLPCGVWHFSPKSTSQPSFGGSCWSYTAVKLGDVTGPYLKGVVNDRSALSLSSQDTRLQPGETYTLTLQAGDQLNLEGLQLMLGFDPAAVRIDGVTASGLPDFDAGAYAVTPEGKLSVSWLRPQGLAVYNGMPLISIAVTALRAIQLSDVIRIDPSVHPSECYETGNAIHPLDLQWQQTEAASKSVQIFPNPANNRFATAFFRTVSGPVSVQLFDAMGRLVQILQVQTTAGWNTVQMEAESAAPGMYLLKIDGEPAHTVMLTGRG